MVPSLNTRRLLVEHGGFLYDSDAYNDELPYWRAVAGRPHLVVPYSLVNNDARFIRGSFSLAEDFFTYLRDTAGLLLREPHPTMMSVGLPHAAGWSSGPRAGAGTVLGLGAGAAGHLAVPPDRHRPPLGRHAPIPRTVNAHALTSCSLACLLLPLPGAWRKTIRRTSRSSSGPTSGWPRGCCGAPTARKASAWTWPTRSPAASTAPACVIEDVNFANLFAALFSKRIEFTVNPLNITAERADRMLFTEPFFATGNGFLIRAADSMAGFDDLKGKAIAVNRGTISDTWARPDNAAKYGFEVQRYETFPDSVQAVLTRRAFAGDQRGADHRLCREPQQGG